jgi:hypothetical protein
MLLSVCDLCKANCPSTTTRRWEHIFGELGLEVVILRGHKPVGDTHVCDGCILKMFWVMVERTNSEFKGLKQSLERRELFCKTKEIEQEQRSTELQQLSHTLTEREKELIEREAVFSIPNEVIKENEILKVENRELKNREITAIRRAEARGRQQAIDEREYPEYVNSVFQREIKRHGGL